MSMHSVVFKKQTRFKGRNGVGRCNGIIFFSNERDVAVEIRPVTSRNVMAQSTWLEIDMSCVDEIIDVLRKIKYKVK